MIDEELLEPLPGYGSQVADPVETVEVPTDASRPFLTTSFDEYTVTEGLLLLLLLLAFIMACVKIVKGGFSWL